jgi:hypothetical protein
MDPHLLDLAVLLMQPRESLVAQMVQLGQTPNQAGARIDAWKDALQSSLFLPLSGALH